MSLAVTKLMDSATVLFKLDSASSNRGSQACEHWYVMHSLAMLSHANHAAPLQVMLHQQCPCAAIHSAACQQVHRV